MSLITGLNYMLFYGMTISIQELGLKSLQINGILLGVTQSLGYLGVFPFTHKMRRKKWLLIFQFFVFLSILSLFFLSLFEKSKVVLLLQTFFSTFFIASLTSAQFPLIFLYISELFPTNVRGVANAIILFFGKLVGTLTPFLIDFCEKRKIHILVGCGILVFLSFPCTFLLDETLEEEGKSEYRGARRDKPLDLTIGDDYFRQEEDKEDEADLIF